MELLQHLYDINRCDMHLKYQIVPFAMAVKGHERIPLNQPPLGVEISLFVESFSVDPPE